MRKPSIMKWNAMAALLAAALLHAVGAVAADVMATVDRDRLVEGETVTLVLQTSDPEQSLDADLTPLLRDFEVLGQRSESQMSIVGGKKTATIRLLVTLEPKRAGAVQIPALSMPGAQTRPVPLMVDAAPELAPGEQPPVFIELALDPSEGPYYVLSQLSLTVKIHYQQNLTEATIGPPEPEAATVRLLDEIPYQVDRKGVQYRVLERRYAVFPERSGELVIPPLKLTGRLIERPADRLWQPAVRGRRHETQSEPLTIAVLPKPQDYSGTHWLPARRITLSQQIPSVDELRVGEPVTRSVIVDAVGLEENMLEEPVWPDMDKVRIYPDQPQGISRDDGRWVLGHKEFRYAVVPEQAGELVLPEIRLDWWDTVNNRQETAVLPAHSMMVAPQNLVPESSAGQSSVTAQVQPGPVSERVVGGYWRWTTLLFALLWLATLAMNLFRSHRHTGLVKANHAMSADEDELLAQLRKACSRRDAASARRALSAWLRRYGPETTNGSLMEFSLRLGEDPLAAAIRAFDAGSFAPGASGDWDGPAFWGLFRKWQRAGRQEGGKEGGVVPDLYSRVR